MCLYAEVRERGHVPYFTEYCTVLRTPYQSHQFPFDLSSPYPHLPMHCAQVSAIFIALLI
jgi:hypothetical protein